MTARYIVLAVDDWTPPGDRLRRIRAYVIEEGRLATVDPDLALCWSHTGSGVSIEAAIEDAIADARSWDAYLAEGA